MTCAYDPTGVNTTQYIASTVDLGLSDVDPMQFTGNNVSSGLLPFTAKDLANITVQNASTVVFGEPVTWHLYQALQAVQLATGQIQATVPGTTTACTVGDRTHEACMPSLSSAQIAAIHTGSVTDWNQFIVKGTNKGFYDWTVANAPAYAPAANFPHICRLANGSGAQAQHNAVFLNYPCDPGATAT